MKTLLQEFLEEDGAHIREALLAVLADERLLFSRSTQIANGVPSEWKTIP